LKLAAAAARTMKSYAKADELTARIPIDAERKNAEMLNMLAQRKPQDVIERFGAEDLTKWPFWAAGEGYLARARAYAAAGDKSKSDADFNAALELTSDNRVRAEILKALGKKSDEK